MVRLQEKQLGDRVHLVPTKGKGRASSVEEGVFIPATPTSALPFIRRWWIGPILFLTDVLSLQLALGMGFLLRMMLLPLREISMGWRQYEILAALMLAVPLGSLLLGLYPGYGLGPVARIRRRTITIGVLMGLLVLLESEVLNLFLPELGLPRMAILMTMLLSVILCPLVESFVVNFLINRGFWGSPVVVIGSQKTLSRVIQTLRNEQILGWVPVAAFCEDRLPDQQHVAQVPLLGPPKRARALAGLIHIAILAPPTTHQNPYTELASRLRFRKIVIVPDWPGLPALGIRARNLGGLASLEINQNLLELHNLILKRALDYLIGVPVFLLSLPLLGVLALLIKIISPGPALYTQERIGMGGKRIKIWKLRTMYTDAEQRLVEHLKSDANARAEWDRHCKLKDDPRILGKLGRFLRRSSLDELPQLWNVITGQMSLVGPRPFPEYHLSKFRRDFRGLRRRVWPGLTGLWQISSRSEGGTDVQQLLDTYYIHNWSIWLDLYICSRTFSAVWKGKGAY